MAALALPLSRSPQPSGCSDVRIFSFTRISVSWPRLSMASLHLGPWRSVSCDSLLPGFSSPDLCLRAPGSRPLRSASCDSLSQDFRPLASASRLRSPDPCARPLVTLFPPGSRPRPLSQGSRPLAPANGSLSFRSRRSRRRGTCGGRGRSGRMRVFRPRYARGRAYRRVLRAARSSRRRSAPR